MSYSFKLFDYKNLCLISFFTCSMFVEARGGDVVGKVTSGYQGWFRTPGDGANESWRHWGAGSAGKTTFEMWPDVREYPESTLEKTEFEDLANGQPAKLFTSYSSKVVDLHFAWMEEYGIDGVAMQRFGGEIDNPKTAKTLTDILQFTEKAARAHGRTFYVCYDLSGMRLKLRASSEIWSDRIKRDWGERIDGGSTKVTGSRAYAREDGRVVVQLWGMRINNSPGSEQDWVDLINWFQARGCYVIGGVKSDWYNDSAYERAYRAFDMISPWAVGCYNNESDIERYKWNSLVPFIEATTKYGNDLLPVVHPGFAWSHLYDDSPFNQMKRNQGQFFWKQIQNLSELGIKSVYIAMFDEYDESTNIMKAASDSSMVPSDEDYLTTSSDGIFCSSDFYLRLAGAAGQVLSGAVQFTPEVPIPLSVGPVWWRSGFEHRMDAELTWENSILNIINIEGTKNYEKPVCFVVEDGPSIRGSRSVVVAGNDVSSKVSALYFQAVDVDIPVNEKTQLSYVKYTGNELGRYVGVDLLMTDGSTLRMTGALDQDLASMRPSMAKGRVGEYTKTVCHIGRWLNGKRIDKILIGYDNGSAQGEFLAWIDDISIEDVE
jgi:hypothetical protein